MSGNRGGDGEFENSSEAPWMDRALELAARGEGWVEPNPMVGCVLVRDGRIVGEGWHRRYGGAHAEVEALAAAGAEARGAHAYVTLEPCAHFGKTPPCADALIAAGVARVTMAMQDPFPKVAGAGRQRLRDAGIEVQCGLRRSAAERLAAPYLTRLRQRRPWVIAKWAMTLDGKIATRRGDSQWISSPSSRRHGHQLRGRVDAVVVGVGTVAADDPQLTARPAGPRLAARVVVDPHLRTPLDSRLVQTARSVPVLIAGRICERPARAAALRAAGCELLSTIETAPSDIARETLLTLAARGMTNVLVEGGGGLLGSLRDGGLIDEVHVFIAPRLAGGGAAVTPLAGVGVGSIADAETLDDWVVRTVERDLWISGRVRRDS